MVLVDSRIDIIVYLIYFLLIVIAALANRQEVIPKYKILLASLFLPFLTPLSIWGLAIFFRSSNFESSQDWIAIWVFPLLLLFQLGFHIYSVYKFKGIRALTLVFILAQILISIWCYVVGGMMVTGIWI